MEKIRNTPYWHDVEKLIQSISIHNRLFQNYFNASLKDVKLEVNQVSTQFQDVLNQINMQRLTAPTKDGDDMSEAFTDKLHSIDTRLTRTETLVEQMSIKLDKMDAKLDGLATKDYVEKEISKSETSTIKWIVGSGIVVIAALSGIVFGIIKSVHP